MADAPVIPPAVPQGAITDERLAEVREQAVKVIAERDEHYAEQGADHWCEDYGCHSVAPLGESLLEVLAELSALRVRCDQQERALKMACRELVTHRQHIPQHRQESDADRLVASFLSLVEAEGGNT